MLDTMNTQIRKQVAQMIDLNHKALSWQLEQAGAFSKLTMDSAKVSVDSFLAAQRAILDAMTPAS